MSMNLILSLFPFLLILSGGCSADEAAGKRREKEDQQFHQCDLMKLTATDPVYVMEDEAGVTEIWEYQTPEFLCAGVVAARLVIHPGGLLLPSYNTAPFLTFVQRGKGVHGVVLPGCPNSFESESESSTSPEMRDHYQKLSRIGEGDVISSPAGVVQWTYNDGYTDFVSITLMDSKSFQNQLDQSVRSFFIAGKSQQSREYSGNNGGNIFSGFREEIVRAAFPGVDKATIHKIQAKNDERGSIVSAPHLHFQIPEESQEEEDREKERTKGAINGFGKSLCNLKFRHNLNKSSHTDYFNPNVGRINTVNGKTLPILQFLRLSAEHVLLHKNAILGPQWMVNAHRAVYLTNGEGSFEVVNNEGNNVFDDVVRRGQILVIPQGYAMAVKAGGEGLEWVEMRTNDNAVSSGFAGKTSVLGAIPADVLASAFDVSREEALRLKNRRQEEVGIFRAFESCEVKQNDAV